MGARNGTHMQYSMGRDQWELTGRCVGNAGATPTGLKGIGVTSLVWVSTGKYRITLDDKWAALLNADFRVIDSTGAKHFSFTVKSETVSTTKIIEFDVYSGATTVAPTRADLAATDTLLFTLKLANSLQVPRNF